MRAKTKVLMVFLLLGCLICSGCRDRHEIEEMGFVQWSAFDRTADGLIQVTVHIAKPFAIASKSGPPIDEKPFWPVSSTGHTCYQAVRNLASESPRIVFWGHDRIMLIGERLAREGFPEVLDWVSRTPELRGNIQLMVVKGCSVEEIAKAIFELERQPIMGFLGIIKGVQERQSTSFGRSLLEIRREMETEGVESVIPAVKCVQRSPHPTEPGELREVVVARTAKIEGLAVFKGERLVGWLDDRHSRGVLWVRGKVQSGIIVIRDPLDENNLISIRIGQTSGKIIPEMVDGRPVIRVIIKAEGDLLESSRDLNLLHNPQIWTSMKRRMATVIRNEVQLALIAAQEDFKSDIFGFGRAVHSSYPQEWQTMKGNWNEIFPTLEVRVEVLTDLEESGLIIRGVQVKYGD